MPSRISAVKSDQRLFAERMRVLNRKYATIHDFAIALICLVHHRDADGREIGYDYGWIHEQIIRKFPVVLSKGPHEGKPTKMPYKELQAVTGELNRKGVKLPFRPRRRATKETKRQIRRATKETKRQISWRKYNRSEKGRATFKRYNKSPKGWDRAWRYRQTAKYREAKRRYQQSPKGLETDWSYKYERAQKISSRTPGRRQRNNPEKE